MAMTTIQGFMGLSSRHVGAAILCALLCHPAAVRAEDPAEKPAVASAASHEAHKEPGVNINSASLTELQMLPGIGERKAEGIIARREKKKFARPEELMEVKGIGRGIFKRCKPYVRVAGPTTLAQKVAGTGGTRKG
jgi:competence protein ComEA